MLRLTETTASSPWGNQRGKISWSTFEHTAFIAVSFIWDRLSILASPDP